MQVSPTRWYTTCSLTSTTFAIMNIWALLSTSVGNQPTISTVIHHTLQKYHTTPALLMIYYDNLYSRLETSHFPTPDCSFPSPQARLAQTKRATFPQSPFVPCLLPSPELAQQSQDAPTQLLAARPNIWFESETELVFLVRFVLAAKSTAVASAAAASWIDTSLLCTSEPNPADVLTPKPLLVATVCAGAESAMRAQSTSVLTTL